MPTKVADGELRTPSASHLHGQEQGSGQRRGHPDTVTWLHGGIRPSLCPSGSLLALPQGGLDYLLALGGQCPFTELTYVWGTDGG